jgi:hypothetical protein
MPHEQGTGCDYMEPSPCAAARGLAGLVHFVPGAVRRGWLLRQAHPVSLAMTVRSRVLAGHLAFEDSGFFGNEAHREFP